MTFSLTILGSSSALPTISKYPAAHVLNVHEQFYLIDCGEGVQRQLKKYDINPLKIDHIFISHLHGDHVFGLFGLISSMGLIGRKKALEIFAPAPIGEILCNHLRFFDRNLPYKLVWHEVDCKKAGVIYENNVMEVSTFPLKHSVPTVGFLFREKTPAVNVRKWEIEKHGLSLSQIVRAKNGEDILLENGTLLSNAEITYTPYNPRSFAYCCDTAYTEKILPYIYGVDLLYHESTFLQQDAPSAKKTLHSTTIQAAEIAAKANVGKLIVGHFSTRYKLPREVFQQEAATVFANSVAAKEGDTHAIEVVKNR